MDLLKNFKITTKKVTPKKVYLQTKKDDLCTINQEYMKLMSLFRFIVVPLLNVILLSLAFSSVFHSE